MNWETVADIIRKSAETCWPQEACGVVMADGTVEQSENVAEPARMRNVRYTIEPRILRMKDWQKISGFYHSHTNGSCVPSTHDLVRYPDKFEIICAISGGLAGAVAFYRAEGTRWVCEKVVYPWKTQS